MPIDISFDGVSKNDDDPRLAGLARDAAAYICQHGSALDWDSVLAELGRRGCSVAEAADAIEYGLHSGTLILMGSRMKLDAGFVSGHLPPCGQRDSGLS